jgi:hypothetical protein
MNRSKSYSAFYIPADIAIDRRVAFGIKWLLEQPGDRLILFHAKNMVGNNRLIARAVDEYGFRVEAPRTVWRSGWVGGPILAPWASRDVIRCIEDELAFEATAVCVIGWTPGDPNHAAWIAARNAVDLESGIELGRQPEQIITDPVVRIALDAAERFVNHNNALVQADDKAYLIRTLQELIRGGHRFELDALATYAMATGWTADEIDRIREYGQKVLDGRGFRLQTPTGPKRNSCRHWEAEASKLS